MTFETVHDRACPFERHCYCDDTAPHDQPMGRQAQAIETQRAETKGLGAKHESAVPKECAQPLSGDHP